MKRTLKKIGKVSVTVLLWLMVLLLLWIAAGTVLKDEKQMSPWGTGLFTVTTGSMTPAIAPGTMILVHAVPADQINNGDVITYYADQIAVTHRVVDVKRQDEEYIYTTRGDANNTDDTPIAYENVVGKVVVSLPLLGFLPDLFYNRIFSGLVIIVIGCAILFFAVKSGHKKDMKGEVKSI